MSERIRISSLLQRHGIRLSHRLGQNFLVDTTVLGRVVAAVGADAECDVVEIGAGVGNLSAALARTGARVTALELDPRFMPTRHAKPLSRATVRNLRRKMPAHLRASLTFDNGKEFADFKNMELGLGLAVYFADPHSP